MIIIINYLLLTNSFAAFGVGNLVQSQSNTADDEQPQHLTNDGKWSRLQFGYHGIHNFNY